MIRLDPHFALFSYFLLSIFSFISGFAVFSALGHMSFVEGLTLKELDEAGLTRSFGLVFGT